MSGSWVRLGMGLSVALVVTGCRGFFDHASEPMPDSTTGSPETGRGETASGDTADTVTPPWDGRFGRTTCTVSTPLDARLTRWPWLQHVGPDKITVRFMAALGSTATLSVGRADQYGPELALETTPILVDERPESQLSEQMFTAQLTGLAPHTEYCYRISVNGAVVADGLRLHTSNEEDEAIVRFVAFGDYGAGTPEQLLVRDRIAERLDGVDFWITTGDNAYDRGLRHEWRERVFDVYADLWHRVVMVPAVGNHDDLSEDGAPYLELFELPEQTLAAEEAERYYTMRWGPVQVIVLDSERGLSRVSEEALDDQVDWLKGVLADGAEIPWRIAVWHRPPYQGQVGRDPDLRSRALLSPLIEAAGVPLVLNGHNHHYERMLPIRDGVADPTGTTYVITGTGGRYLYPLAPWELQAVGVMTQHFLVAEASRCVLNVVAVDLYGNEIDRFSFSRCE